MMRSPPRRRGDTEVGNCRLEALGHQAGRAPWWWGKELAGVLIEREDNAFGWVVGVLAVDLGCRRNEERQLLRR